MFEGNTYVAEHEGNQLYLVKDRAWMSWEWSGQ